MKKNRNTLVDIALLVAITIIAYLPVSAHLFSLKNDSLVQYLPFRYHLSESIQHGYFPFWSPYLYTGFPIHADMQGMTWNPFVLIISLFTRYNMSVLELEVTIYLVLAAVGMYSLLKSFGLGRLICIVGAVSYMCSGFINGSASVIPWISSAAFIPFVFRYLKLFLEKRDVKSSLLFSASLSLLFLCGYPTFFIYTCYIILAAILFSIISNYNNRKEFLTWKTTGLFMLAAIVFFCVCSPAIVSYMEFLPYYSRGAGITAAKAAENPFTLYSSLSFLAPNAVHKEHAWLNTDPSMRNSYVGIFVFIIFSLSFLYKKNRWQRFAWGITIFSFLLSLGSATPLHKMAYYILPLFDTFRHPGNIRLFTSIGIILLAALFVQQWKDSGSAAIRKRFLWACYGAGGLLMLAILYCSFQPAVFNNITTALGKITNPKLFLDELRFPSFLLLQSLIQLLFIGVMIFMVTRKTSNRKAVGGLLIMNVVLFCWIALPFTFISQIRTKTVNAYVASFPDGYPIPDLNTPVDAFVFSDSTGVPVYGYPNFYSKKITVQDHIITPTLNKSYEEFNANRKLRKLLKDYPLAWLNDTIVDKLPDSIDKRFSLGCYVKKDWKDSTTGSVELVEFSPGKFRFRVRSDQHTKLTLFQQFNFNWEVTTNGKKSERLRMNTAFMGTPVPVGESEIIFQYKPNRVITAAFVSLSVLVLLLAYLIYCFTRNRKSA